MRCCNEWGRLLRVVLVVGVRCSRIFNQSHPFISTKLPTTGLGRNRRFAPKGAMEAALASGVLEVAGDKLVQLITGEFASIMGVTKDLSELQDIFEEITRWLSKVGDRAIASDSSVGWVKKLKNVAYDIDDVLYEAHLEAEKHKADDDDDNHHVMANCFYAKPKSVLSRRKMARKIKTIKEKFAAIVKQRSDVNAIVNIAAGDHPDRHNMTIGEISILGNVGESTIRVRDEEKHMIISKLVETNEREKILTVSIVGLGGSGKTTLAKHICEDKKIKEHFQDAVYWVHVSEEFDVFKLVGKLFEAVAKKKSDLETNQKMIEEISEKLNHKKFLLVLDDAWHERQQEWEQFTGFLKSGAPGSRILLTTRNKRVSEAVKSTNPFDLELLTLDDSWKFFQQCYGWAEEDMHSEFIEVGKDIVRKCGGVPLAIKALAGALSCNYEREIDAWQTIRDSNLLSVQDIKEGVMGSLRLSYFHLPDDLKQCFVLCSISPKGYMIDKEQLIDQWIAHDMITPTDGVDNLDVKYKRCFDTLAQMSFLQDVTENYDGRVTCRMHDLVHDLARSILGDEIALAVPNKTTKSTKSYRYFSLIEQQGKVPPKHFFVKGRAMYVAKGDIIFGKVLKRAKILRSITVENITTESVLAAVLQIKNLRYLAISVLECEALPEAISDIWSLQALHVTYSHRLCGLPKSIGKLQKLRTLNLSGCIYLESLPDSIGDCQMISSVDLCGCRALTTVPNSIGRNKNLRVLRLCHTRIERLPSSITTLENLEILDLEECTRLVELPEGMKDLTKLKVLNLEDCNNLSGIPVGIEQLSRLQKLGMFVVGEGQNFAKISELGNAGGIGGRLTIRNIVFVKDPDDAQKARLKHKTNLQGLSLDWCKRFPDLIDECWSNDAEKELAVLNALEPPPSRIESIEVYGYPGGQFAQWMLKQIGVRVDHPHFPCLTRVRLVNFPNLKHLQGLAKLPLLRELHLEDMPTLESISGGPFSSLVSLEMHRIPSLEEMWMVPEDETFVDYGEGQQIQVQIGSLLSKLTIYKCPKLKVKLYLPSSLAYLRLDESNEQLLVSPFRLGQGSFNDAEGLPPSFSHLKRLDLSRMTVASSSPGSGSAGHGWELLQHLTALDSLDISNCEGLSELPESMRSLKSLRSLDIRYCPHLRVLPEWLGELRSLRSLSIEYLHCLSSLPHSLQHLTALDSLHISNCSALRVLPERLGELRSLRSLTISSSPRLSSLPRSLQHLTSLQVLKIVGCDALHQLLESLGELRSLQMLEILNLPCLSSLPHSLQHLTSLQELQIGGCDALQLPEWLGKLCSLRSLEISHLPRLSSLPHSLQHLTSLQELEIRACAALRQLPESLGELRSLRRFVVCRLPGLTRLPRSMRLLTSLEELRIWNCPGLTFLPGWIQGLTALQELHIQDCPRLESRCERGKGEDWHLVSRIPRLHIW